MSRLKKLKSFNEKNLAALYVYVSEHLPKELYEQKKTIITFL